MKSISWIGSKGQTIELRAECETYMVDKTADLDGDIITIGKEPYTKANLELWVDGKLIESCWNTAFWQIIDSNGIKKIWGLPVGMSAEQAEKVDEFLKTIIAEGKNTEVKEHEDNKVAAEKAEEIKKAQIIIEKAKNTHRNQDGTLMTAAQAKEWKRNYNNIHNEGGTGYVPEIITKEMYDNAKAVLDAK